ncbi:hypothetical protein HanPI659440_Chr00c04g0711691 [Helianthus annuus]|nr:hypothetical protein HanPI659440_Chr00c04g0711691 [Helianthus annuus]
MEQNNGGGRIIIDEDLLNNDKIVGYRSSSSSTSSYSNRFEVDVGEDDAAFYEFEEHDSASGVLNSESPTMTSTLPQNSDLDTVYGAIKQSPPVQVMGEPAGYDLNRSPSPMFGLKHRSNSEWSLGSSDSLFSIRTGNNSFSLDGGFYLSKSGELNWIDDKLSPSPGLPTVMDTSAENERKSGSTNSESGEKEETVETKNASLVDSEKEKGNLSASLSADSFAFPVLAGGGPSPTKVETEKPQPAPSTPPAEAAQATPKAPPATPKAGGNQWYHCFSCFPMCC